MISGAQRCAHLGSPRWALALLGIAGGCTGGADTATVQTGTDAWADRQPIFEVTWGAEALELAIYRGTGRSWWMGMAVTDPPQGRDGWTGED